MRVDVVFFYKVYSRSYSQIKMGSSASILERNTIKQGINVMSLVQVPENCAPATANTLPNEEESNVAVYVTSQTTHVNRYIPCAFDLCHSSSAEVLGEVLTFAAARFDECAGGSAAIYVEELQCLLVEISHYS